MRNLLRVFHINPCLSPRTVAFAQYVIFMRPYMHMCRGMKKRHSCAGSLFTRRVNFVIQRVNVYFRSSEWCRELEGLMRVRRMCVLAHLHNNGVIRKRVPMIPNAQSEQNTLSRFTFVFRRYIVHVYSGDTCVRLLFSILVGTWFMLAR